MELYRERRCSSPKLETDLIESKNLTRQTFEEDSLLKLGDSTKSLLLDRSRSTDDDSLNDSEVEDSRISNHQKSDKDPLRSLSKRTSHSKEVPKEDKSSSQSISASDISRTIGTETKSNQSTYSQSPTKSHNCTDDHTDISKKTFLGNEGDLNSNSQASETIQDLTKSLLCNEKDTVQNVQSWDEWALQKAINDMKQLQLKRQLKREEEKKREQEEEERRKRLEMAKEVRRDWVKKKKYAIAKNEKETQAQQEFELLKKEQGEQIVQSKAKERFCEWSGEKEKLLRKRKEEELKKKRKELHEKALRELESKKVYDEWLDQAKKKKVRKRTSYGYMNGSLFRYYDMTSTPPPSYTNPVPWVSPHQ